MVSFHTDNRDRPCRYERKFYLEDTGFAEVEACVRMNPVLFREIFHARWVNNIYFDTLDHDCYLDNVEGSLFRTKQRIRWYGEPFGLIEKPTLEFKLKQGLVGRKESFRLSAFTLDSAFSRTTMNDLIGRSELPEAIRLRLRNSVPTLLNRYLRKYFLSADGRFRITIDAGMEYRFIGTNNNTFIHPIVNDRDIILELKYGVADDEDATAITGAFPFRVSKSSKYVQGVEVTTL